MAVLSRKKHTLIMLIRRDVSTYYQDPRCHMLATNITACYSVQYIICSCHGLCREVKCLHCPVVFASCESGSVCSYECLSVSSYGTSRSGIIAVGFVTLRPVIRQFKANAFWRGLYMENLGANLHFI